jgi:hypothetical protein
VIARVMRLTIERMMNADDEIVGCSLEELEQIRRLCAQHVSVSRIVEIGDNDRVLEAIIVL